MSAKNYAPWYLKLMSERYGKFICIGANTDLDGYMRKLRHKGETHCLGRCPDMGCTGRLWSNDPSSKGMSQSEIADAIDYEHHRALQYAEDMDAYYQICCG